ncbi:MAG: Mur ligase family protein [Opitutales bacterium]
MKTPLQLVPRASAALGGRPLAVLGAGVSGRAAAALARRLGVAACLYDERDGEPFSQDAAESHSLVVTSPGFAPRHPWLELARSAGLQVWTEFDWAAAHCDARFVAVTGTNGKSSLSRLLTRALTKAGRTAVEAGNSGRPLSAYLAEETAPAPEFVVAEISSFQAELLEVLRPDALLWTTFAPDHLDRHGNLSAYFAAKYRLVEALAPGGKAWAGPSVPAAAAALGYPPNERLLRVAPTGPAPEPFGLGAPAIGWFLARAFWQAEGLSESALEQAARAFQPLPHRFQWIRDVAGVSYFNDSKATNFEAAIAAVRSTPGPLYWIAGGKSKGEDSESLIEAAAPHVTTAFLIGETAPALAAACHRQRVSAVVCDRLETAVERATAAARLTAPASVLLSPGMASQDQFRDFVQRGEVFTRAVFRLPETEPDAILSSPSYTR